MLFNKILLGKLG
jgi:hypothetical protein